MVFIIDIDLFIPDLMLSHYKENLPATLRLNGEILHWLGGENRAWSDGQVMFYRPAIKYPHSVEVVFEKLCARNGANKLLVRRKTIP